MAKKKDNRDIIILDFMFSGDYLTDNIGHEIINLYTSDSGKQYVYLCKDGKFNPQSYPVERIKHIVFLRRTELPHQLEVIGFTVGELEYIAPTDIRQWNVTYGGKSVGSIFRNNLEQQEVNLTFGFKEGQKGEYRIIRPEESVIIDIEDIRTWREKNKDKYGFTLNDKVPTHIFNPCQTLRKYMFSPGDSSTTKTIDTTSSEGIETADYLYLKDKLETLVDPGTVVPIISDIKSEDVQRFASTEIYGILNRELSYSNALKFFIDRYPEEFKEFFGKMIKSTEITTESFDLGKYCRTLREWSHIDLIVEYENAVFVIENKIFSKLNGVKMGQNHQILSTQLNDYENVIAGQNNKKKMSFQNKENIFYMILLPNHNLLDVGNTAQEKWQEVRYSALNDFLIKLKKEWPEDEYLKDFQRTVSYHSDVDYNYSIMDKRFKRAISSAETVSKTYCKKEDLSGSDGLFSQLKNTVYQDEKPIMLVFSDNRDVDDININTINSDREIYKINAFLSDSIDVPKTAKCIVCHKYVDLLNIEELKKAIKLQKKQRKPLVFFVNNYSFDSISVDLKKYIEEEFVLLEYKPIVNNKD